MSLFKKIQLQDSVMDAANRVRVSQLTTLGDYKQINDNQPLFYDEEVIGGTASATYDANEGGVEMVVDDTNAKVVRQTKMWHTYFAGKSQIFEVTASDFHPQTDVTKRMGYYSSSTSTPFSANLDGIFCETANGGEHTFNVYKNGTSVLTVAQSNWNVDKLDGNGPSGLTMSGSDWRRFVVFGADFLYLGGTSVAFGFFAKRKFNICHVYDHAMTNNTVQAPMIKSPNQPLRWEIFATGDGTQGLFNQICGQVSTEGAVNKIGVSRGIDTGTSPITLSTSGTNYGVIGIKLKTAERNITIQPTILEILCSSNDNYRWLLILNPTVTGTFSYNPLTNSAIEAAIGTSSPTVTGGTVLLSGYGTSNSVQILPTEPSLRIGSKIDGTMDEIVLAITPLSTNATFFAGLNVEEFR